jgi:hypothetical protein
MNFYEGFLLNFPTFVYYLDNNLLSMKITFTILLLHFSTFLLANETSDSTKKVWQFHGIIQVNNNGISPVPAFSLGRPALMTTFFVQKRGFTFSPEFNYALDGKPWVVNQWLRYQKQHERFTFRTGINMSLFFTRNEPNMKLNQYMALEGAMGYRLSKKSTLNLIYWYSKGLDPTAVKSGHFLSLSASISKIPVAKSLVLDLRPNVFYLTNKIPFKGVFVSAIASIAHKKYPVSIFLQAVQPIKVSPVTPFNWNYGLSYIF